MTVLAVRWVLEDIIAVLWLMQSVVIMMNIAVLVTIHVLSRITVLIRVAKITSHFILDFQLQMLQISTSVLIKQVVALVIRLAVKWQKDLDAVACLMLYVVLIRSIVVHQTQPVMRRRNYVLKNNNLTSLCCWNKYFSLFCCFIFVLLFCWSCEINIQSKMSDCVL